MVRFSRRMERNAATGHRPMARAVAGWHTRTLKCPLWASTLARAGGQDTSRVEALLERLITRVERLEARVGEVGDNTRATAEVQDDVTAGGNATRTEIMNVAELAKAIAKEIA